MKELQWEVYYIYITPKILSPNFGWGVVSPFWSVSDIESKKSKSHLCLLISKWHWVQKNLKLSPENLSPNIRYGGVTTLAQNTSSFQEVSPPRQRHLVLMTCNTSSPSRLEMIKLLWEAYYIYITQKILSSNFGWGVVSIGSASDTEFQNPKSQV